MHAILAVHDVEAHGQRIDNALDEAPLFVDLPRPVHHCFRRAARVFVRRQRRPDQEARGGEHCPLELRHRVPSRRDEHAALDFVVGEAERREHDRRDTSQRRAVGRGQIRCRQLECSARRARETLRAFIARVFRNAPECALIQVETLAEHLEQVIEWVGKRSSRSARQSLGKRGDEQQEIIARLVDRSIRRRHTLLTRHGSSKG